MRLEAGTTIPDSVLRASRAPAVEVRGIADAAEVVRTFDPASQRDWCELVRDVIAAANSGGGTILVHGQPHPWNPAAESHAVKSLEKELARLKSRLASNQGDDLAAQAIDVRGIKVLAAAMEGADARSLRETMDKLKDKLGSAVIVLGAVDGGKVQLAAGVTADATGKVKAGDLVNYVAQQVGGKGGGRADMAMAGGTDPSKLAPALASVRAWAEQRL